MAILVSLNTGSLHQPGQEPSSTFSYAEYDRLTRAHVNSDGRVNYAGLKQEMAALESFVDQLASTSPENKPDLFPSEDERKRYYLTAYNAYVLFFGAAEYPDKHALWSSLGWFKNRDIVLGGRKLTLNDLEHGAIREKFLDPRVHFYLNSGAISCPPLRQGAIREGATEAELEVATLRFINDRANVLLDRATNTLYLSRIFAWHQSDFLDFARLTCGIERPEIPDYIALYLRGEQASAIRRMRDQITVKYFEYNRGLNEQ